MTMRTRFLNRAAHAALAAAAGLAVFAPVQALAQDTELGEVVVTAQKRSENLNDVPVSVTAISAEKLDVIQSSGGDIRVFSARIPNVTLESSYARIFPRPYIRGLGNTDFDFNASQPVSFVYDEVVMENPVLRASRCSTSTASKRCAGRRARCSAATPRPAWSRSTPSSRPTRSPASARWRWATWARCAPRPA